MFDTFLVSDRGCKFGLPEWIANLQGVVRVPILDPNDPAKAYVVVYYERRRSYAAVCFSPNTGEEYWRCEVTNGGYGAPAVIGNTLFVLSGFSNIVGIDTDRGSRSWEFMTEARVRSPISIDSNNAFFSSGGTIYEIGIDGTDLMHWQLPDAFFFGKVQIWGQFVVSLAVTDEFASVSELVVAAFYRTGDLAYTKRIGPGFVVSSDTSGLFVLGPMAYLGAKNEVLCLRLADGEIQWRAPVDGFAGRQMCTAKDDYVYYTTQNGCIGALSAQDGAPMWLIRSRDRWIVSPISIGGDRLYAIFDAHLHALEAGSGKLLGRTPVGHTPYSMATLLGDRLIVGAGEPPHHGFLVCYASIPDLLPRPHIITQCLNAWINQDSLQLLVELVGRDEEIRDGEAYVGAFSTAETVMGNPVDGRHIRFDCPIRKTTAPSEYAVLLRLDSTRGNSTWMIALVPIERRGTVPSRVHLSGIPDFVQDKENYSGAAVLQAAQQIWGGKPNSQKAIRDMCDFAMQKSGYEPFQIWRIILRRMMATSATSVLELPEFSDSPSSSNK